jgi:hypothetical protein
MPEKVYHGTEQLADEKLSELRPESCRRAAYMLDHAYKGGGIPRVDH